MAGDPGRGSPLGRWSRRYGARAGFPPPRPPPQAGEGALAQCAGRSKRKAPARLPGGRNFNCGFSPSTTGGTRQKNGCQDSRLGRSMADAPGHVHCTYWLSGRRPDDARRARHAKESQWTSNETARAPRPKSLDLVFLQIGRRSTYFAKVIHFAQTLRAEAGSTRPSSGFRW
jgi:hypothetical protein